MNSLRGSNTAPVLAEIRRRTDVFINPIKENLAVAGNGVPSFVERVVTLVVAVRIGRLRSEGHAGYGGYHPGGENAGIRRSTQFIHDLLHGRDHLLRR